MVRICPFKLVQQPEGNSDVSYIRCESACTWFLFEDNNCAFVVAATALKKISEAVHYIAYDKPASS